jgi:hypothetical protein
LDRCESRRRNSPPGRYRGGKRLVAYAWYLFLSELPCDPLRRRVGCDVDPDEISAINPYNHEAIQQFEANGRDHEQNHGGNVAPWQNGFAERLIGSIRRECLDHIIVSGEAHLRRTLISYAAYYNSVRTHRSLNKDAPIFRPIQQIGIIRSHPILGGLHHHYVRV